MISSVALHLLKSNKFLPSYLLSTAAVSPWWGVETLVETVPRPRRSGGPQPGILVTEDTVPQSQTADRALIGYLAC